MRDLIRSQIDIFLAIIISVCVFIIDRLTKTYFSDLLSLHESLPIIPKVLDMTLVHNTGIAFGLFKDQGAVFIVIPIVAIILLVFNIYFYKKNDLALNRIYVAGFSLILGGAFGNLVDRIQYGYVIDFIDFHVWPVFNIADSAISIGAVLIAWKCLELSKTENS